MKLVQNELAQELVNEWHWVKIEDTDWISNGGIMLSPLNFAVFYDSGRILPSKSAAKCRRRINLVATDDK